jgi:SNF2 family DNA or RNA helicase
MLRRRKDQIINGKALIELPKRTVNVVSCDFDPSEKYFYDSLETKMEGVIEKLMETSKGNSSYISVLLLLLRLRQGTRISFLFLTGFSLFFCKACNHPILVAKDYKKDLDAVDPKAVAKGQDDKDADGDDLATAFGQMGVTRKCQMCTTE